MISSRHDAITSKVLYYFTGKPCRKGHIAERYASSGNCLECSLIRRQPAKEFRAAARRDRDEQRRHEEELGLLNKRTRRREDLLASVADEFIEVFQATVLAMSRAKDPRLTLQQVNLTRNPKRTDKGKDVKLYKFKVFPEDLNAVTAFKNNLYKLWQHTEIPTAPVIISTRAKKWITLRAKQK